jgi:hypothetical protein
MAELPNVSIRLVPSTAARYTPMLAGPFILFDFDTAPSIVHLEHHRASASLWQRADVDEFRNAVAQIEDMAMSPEHTVDTIGELIKGTERA